MNQPQQIQLIETKIKEIQSTLTLWKQEIEKFNTQLQQLTKKLTNIKKRIK